MKIPAYIQKIIDQRCRLAEELTSLSVKLDDWLMKQGIDTCNDYTTTGVLIYTEPFVAKKCVEEAILTHEKVSSK